MSLKWQTVKQLEQEFVTKAKYLMEQQGYWCTNSDKELTVGSTLFYREDIYSKKYPVQVIGIPTLAEYAAQDNLLGEKSSLTPYIYKVIKLD